MRDYEKCPTVGMIETEFPIKINNNDIDDFLKLMKKFKQQQIIFWVSNYKQRLFVSALSLIGLKHMIELNEPLYLVCNRKISKEIEVELKDFITEVKETNEENFCMLARDYIKIKDLIDANEIYNLLKNQKGKVIIEDDAETFRLNGKLFSAYEYVAKNEYDSLDVAVCLEDYENNFFNKIKKFERTERNNGYSMTDANIKNREKL